MNEFNVTMHYSLWMKCIQIEPLIMHPEWMCTAWRKCSLFFHIDTLQLPVRGGHTYHAESALVGAWRGKNALEGTKIQNLPQMADFCHFVVLTERRRTSVVCVWSRAFDWGKLPHDPLGIATDCVYTKHRALAIFTSFSVALERCSETKKIINMYHCGTLDHIFKFIVAHERKIIEDLCHRACRKVERLSNVEAY